MTLAWGEYARVSESILADRYRSIKPVQRVLARLA
jgi:hypothetical protein